MIFEGDKGVIDAIKEKKRLMDAGEEHGHIRPLLIANGGLMKGSYGLGALQALEQLGYTSCFPSVVGISSGALSLAYFLINETETAFSLMSVEGVSGEFLHPFSLKNMIDTHFVRSVLEGQTGKALDLNSLINSPVDFYVGVSEYETAKPVLLLSKNTDDTLEALRATIAMPGAVTDEIWIDGKRYVDGESTEPYISKHAIHEIKPTHVLVLTNQEKNDKDIHWLDSFMTQTIFRFRMTKALRCAALNRRKARHQWVNGILNDVSTPVYFSWGDNSIASNELKKEKIIEAIENAKTRWLEVLS